MKNQEIRRAILTMGGAGVLLAACRNEGREELAPFSRSTAPAPSASSARDHKEDDKEEDVGATEDLMREHGVIRRILVVYRESAIRLRSKAASLPVDALQKAASLMRTFGEDYHEKQLEEGHIFPAVKRSAGAAAAEIETLLAQHQRGREITDYVISVSREAIGVANADPLARILEGFARMYEEHAAREDTIIFPAWKKALSPKQRDEMGELFEEIEHKTFGKDGFDDAVDKIAAIEREMGLDPAALIPPPPPKP